LSAKDVDQKSARHTIAHELGHTLGIGHIHDDPKSIMSYLADYDTWIAAILSPSDKVACNDAIKSRYGIDYERPQTIQTSKMTDKEAMEIMRQRQSN